MPTTRAQSGAKTRASPKKQQLDELKTGAKRRAASGTPARKTPPKRVKIEGEVDTKDENGKEAKEKIKSSQTPERVSEKDAKEEVKEEIKPEEEEDTKSATVAKAHSPPPAEFHSQRGILERGHIYFFYRPKVGVEESESIDDVAKLSFLLVPRPPKTEKEEEDPSPFVTHEDGVPIEYFRYIIMGKKHLPDSETKHEVFWGAVADIGNNLSALDEGLEEQVYSTKTKGERHKGAVRLTGRGVYVICTPTNPKLPPSRGERTFLAYNLTHPATPGEVQEELGIEASSSFLIQVKNPDQPNPPNVGLKPDKKAKYPEEGKEETFGTGFSARRFRPANPPTLLDYQGTEVLLVGDKKNLDTILYEGSAQEMQQEADDESQTLTTEAVMREIMLDTEKFPTDALEGHWI